MMSVYCSLQIRINKISTMRTENLANQVILPNISDQSLEIDILRSLGVFLMLGTITVYEVQQMMTSPVPKDHPTADNQL